MAATKVPEWYVPEYVWQSYITYRRKAVILFSSILIIEEPSWLPLRNPHERFDENEYMRLLSYVSIFHNV
jgi:hypothetical protein